MIDKVNTVGVLGFGRTGRSLTRLLLSLGKRVRVSEHRGSGDFPPEIVKYFINSGVEFEFGGHSRGFLKECDLLVLSPGIDINNSEEERLIKKFSLPFVGELELCFWLNKAKIIAITGTNGKSTVTFLTYKVLKENGENVFLGGNIGIPFSRFVLNTTSKDIVVLEVSSFQLETIVKFQPYIACFLNIEEDHLDRYISFEEYFRAKLNIFRNQKSTDWAVLNKNSTLLNVIEKNILAKKVYFSSEFDNENLSAVYRIVSLFGIDRYRCLKTFSNFKGLPHRFQRVARIQGIDFINDSKATNPASTIWALKNIKKPVFLIAGGKDKGFDYSVILPYLRKVKGINLIGESAYKIADIVSGKVRTKIFPSLESAVYDAFSQAEGGQVVLFSPMCASFDMFANYKERGNYFIRIVKSLHNGRKS